VGFAGSGTSPCGLELNESRFAEAEVSLWVTACAHDELALNAIARNRSRAWLDPKLQLTAVRAEAQE